ncbi:flavodoxin [Apilactobacillus micheneri]|uniref:Flavodoxin n=1 Tax=Apilactobacillus micheneri TaxID=1899430 RepID=A0ABY2YXT3_9LACO|nr:flavodoxin [Apilactobacillus micheneri]TPR24774.1 flavodoxin [Apilactobacillus micheneri]TPR26085.1 flavodoxin [Apilactobacillus micheneri]TPR28275.1 flavodoxin [Apilactobacillus micheneri]TPR29766.1 flavodoxin [Apilactobacillus micheneri]TPR30552.1 flavodoxin [Apilactobacillus micheneri]
MLKAHVVFATITGNNEDLADIVTEGLEDLGAEVKETEISQTDTEELLNADICVVCAYTYDEGHLPEEGLDFFDDLADMDLSNKVFGVAGSGDDFYEDSYNTSVDKFIDQFKKANAIQGSEGVKINLEPDENDIKTLDKMSKELVDKYNNLKK